MATTTATTPSTDRIEKLVTLDAPRSRVWRALTDVTQFNQWFGMALGAPFVPGAEVKGNRITIWIESLDAEHFFSFRWHPYALEPGVDYSAEPTTLVTFTLEEVDGGTQLTIIESGFDAIPESRRASAFGMNTKGWNSQTEKLRKYLGA